jgi:hypothetical protein
MPLKYLAVRYEDVIDRQEESARQMLAFAGAPYNRRASISRTIAAMRGPPATPR